MTAEGGGMTQPQKFSKELEPASELIANAMQALTVFEVEGLLDEKRFSYNADHIRGVIELLRAARVRVAATEQDTRRLNRVVENWIGKYGDLVGEMNLLRQALKPFAPAKIAPRLDAANPADEVSWVCTIADLRRVRAALSGLDRETGK